MTSIFGEEIDQIVEFGETTLEALIDTFKELRDKDAATGCTSDEPALGGIAYAAEHFNEHLTRVLLALAVRRLAGVEPR